MAASGASRDPPAGFFHRPAPTYVIVIFMALVLLAGVVIGALIGPLVVERPRSLPLTFASSNSLEINSVSLHYNETLKKWDYVVVVVLNNGTANSAASVNVTITNTTSGTIAWGTATAAAFPPATTASVVVLLSAPVAPAAADGGSITVWRP